MQMVINETRHGFISEYQLMRDDDILYTVKRTLGSYYYDIVDKDGSLIYMAAYERKSPTNEKKVFCDISNKKNKPIGIMSLEKSKKINAYYYQLMLKGNEYKMYEVKLDNDDIKLPIYKDKEQIALVEKDIETKDSKDIYRITCSADEEIIICLFLTIYFDDIRYPRSDMHVVKINSEKLSSISKELKDKYNPDWKPSE